MTNTRHFRLIGAGVLILVSILIGTLFFNPNPPSAMSMTFRPVMLPRPPRSFEVPIESDSPSDQVPKPVAVWLPKSTDRLTVVISGLVGNSTDGLSYAFSDPFRRRNDSVLILPSPSHWTFAFHLMPHLQRTSYRASVTAICRSIETVLALKIRRSFKAVVMAGYSLGARHAISSAPCAQPLFPLAKLSVMAVNPPINLNYSAETLDRLLASARHDIAGLYMKGLGLSTLGAISSALTSHSLRPSAQRQSLDFFLRPFLGEDQFLKELAATSFAVRLEPILTDIENPTYQLWPSQSSFSFKQALSDGPMSTEAFINELHQSPLYKGNGSDLSLSILHSRDDFLVTPQEVNAILMELGATSRAFDHGGHVGLIFEPAFEEWFDTVSAANSL